MIIALSSIFYYIIESEKFYSNLDFNYREEQIVERFKIG